MNDFIIDKRQKGNIYYVKDVELLKTKSILPSYSDMYNFIHNDLSLTICNQIIEDDNGNFLDSDKVDITFLSQDLEGTNSVVKEYITNKQYADSHNISVSCDENNYNNIIAGALKQTILEVEYLKSTLKEAMHSISEMSKKINELEKIQ